MDGTSRTPVILRLCGARTRRFPRFHPADPEQNRGYCHGSRNRGNLHGMAIRVKVLGLATFSPGEAEMITDVSQATQRDWRRRELTSFPTRKGRKRFTSEDLAHLIVLNQLLPLLRPAAAYQLARMSCQAPIRILAKRAYPSMQIKLDGGFVDERDIFGWRYSVYCRFMGVAASSWFKMADLNQLPKQVKKLRASSAAGIAKRPPIAFYVIVDAVDVADQLQARQIKPYITEMEGKERD